MTAGCDSNEVYAVGFKPLAKMVNRHRVCLPKPLLGIVHMVNIEHGEAGRCGIGGDAFAVGEVAGMRQDDRQAALECLLAVVEVGRIGIECGNARADILDFGTIDEYVPFLLGERHGLSFAHAFLVTNSCCHTVLIFDNCR